MAIIPTQSKYPDRAGYLVLNTNTNEVEVFSDGTFKSAVNKVFSAVPEDWVNVKDFGAKGDGVTNDTIAIQNALNSGKNVFIPDGTYIISSQLLIPSNTIVMGNGTKSILKQIDNNSYIRSVLSNSDHINGNSNIIIFNLTVDANRYNQGSDNLYPGGIIIEGKTYEEIAPIINNNIYVLNNTILNANQGIRLTRVYTGVIANNYVYDFSNKAIEAAGSDNIIIKSNTAKMGECGIQSIFSSSVIVSDNTVKDVYTGLSLASGYSNNIFSNNIVHYKLIGCTLRNDVIPEYPILCENNKIINNIFIGPEDNAKATGFTFELHPESIGSMPTFKDTFIENNTFVNNGMIVGVKLPTTLANNNIKMENVFINGNIFKGVNNTIWIGLHTNNIESYIKNVIFYNNKFYNTSLVIYSKVESIILDNNYLDNEGPFIYSSNTYNIPTLTMTNNHIKKVGRFLKTDIHPVAFKLFKNNIIENWDSDFFIYLNPNYDKLIIDGNIFEINDPNRPIFGIAGLPNPSFEIVFTNNNFNTCYKIVDGPTIKKLTFFNNLLDSHLATDPYTVSETTVKTIQNNINIT